MPHSPPLHTGLTDACTARTGSDAAGDLSSAQRRNLAESAQLLMLYNTDAAFWIPAT